MISVLLDLKFLKHAIEHAHNLACKHGGNHAGVHRKAHYKLMILCFYLTKSCVNMFLIMF